MLSGRTPKEHRQNALSGNAAFCSWARRCHRENVGGRPWVPRECRTSVVSVWPSGTALERSLSTIPPPEMLPVRHLHDSLVFPVCSCLEFLPNAPSTLAVYCCWYFSVLWASRACSSEGHHSSAPRPSSVSIKYRHSVIHASLPRSPPNHKGPESGDSEIRLESPRLVRFSAL